MKRILFISNLRMDNGGIETFMMGVYRNSDRKLFKYDFLVDTSIHGYYDDEILRNNDKLLHATFKLNSNYPKFCALLFQNITYFFDLVKVLKKEGSYDIVHCHSLRLNGLSMLAAWICQVPIRITHSHIAPKSIKKHFSWYGLMNFRISQSFIKLFATYKLGCSKEACDFLYGHESTKNKNCKVIFNGIDFDKFNSKKYNLGIIKKRFDIPKDKTIFLNVGRFTNQKNQVFLLKVLDELKKIRKDFICLIVGYGELEEVLKNIVNKYSINEYVKFLSHDTNVAEVISISDFFILPSLYEGLPVVLIEAQAMKKPCIVSDSVPHEVDFGLCSFIDLNKGEQYWAKMINKYIDGGFQNRQYKEKEFGKYDIKNTYEVMRGIYLGKDR